MWFHSLLMIVQILSATCVVALVLVQRGKGADAGAGFGAGASGTVFGARGATTALSRATAIFAAVFMVTSLSLAYMVNRSTKAPVSVLDQLAGQGADTSLPAPAVSPSPDAAAANSAPPAATVPAAPAPAVPAPAPAPK